MTAISKERAERIAKAHVCVRCKEYSFKKLVVKPAPKSIEEELGAIWIAVRICGVCAHQGELGIEADGDIVYET